MTFRLGSATLIGVLLLTASLSVELRSFGTAAAADPNPERKAGQRKAGEKDNGAVDDANERKRLLGTWKVVRMEFEGVSPARVQTSNMFHFGEKEAVGWFEDQDFGDYYDEYVVDSKAKPMRLNITKRSGGIEAVFPNIYEWSGEQLRIVMPGRGVDTKGAKKNLPRLLDRARPKEFKTTPGDQSVWLLVLERVKEPVAIPKRPVDTVPK